MIVAAGSNNPTHKGRKENKVPYKRFKPQKGNINPS